MDIAYNYQIQWKTTKRITAMVACVHHSQTTYTHGHTNACYNSARNNSRSLTIFWPTSTFGRLKSILLGKISCTFSMGQQSKFYKVSYLQKMVNQFLIFISTTVILSETSFTLLLSLTLQLQGLEYTHFPLYGHVQPLMWTTIPAANKYNIWSIFTSKKSSHIS